MDNKVIKNMHLHNNQLSIYACDDNSSFRFKKSNDDFRTPFFKDIDKILYSLSYFRYADKTQVYSFDNNDMISKRMTHIQLVSKIARTIGRGLNLNEDLIEAASLGHDLGHVPFGHTGEKILSELSEKYGEGYFNHNVQSVRTLMNLENNGDGNNVSLQVLDAILCHNGEELKQKYEPMKKTPEEFLKEYESCYTNPSALKNVTAMTLEGCVVRVSDVIAYIGKDIEDAIRLKKINVSQIPKNVIKKLGISNSEIVNTIVTDILNNSIDQNYILISKDIYDTLCELIDFNYKNIYEKANTKAQIEEITKMFNKLFDLYIKQIKNKEEKEDIYISFLNIMSKEYIKSTSDTRKVIDFIAGMTDGYFINQYKKYF